MRRIFETIRIKIAEWMIRRYTKGMKLSDPITLANQQIAELQKQIEALKANQPANPMLTLEARLLAMHPPAAEPVVEPVVEIVTEVIPEPESAQALQQAEPAVTAPESAQALQQAAVEPPIPDPQPPAALPPEPEPDMSTLTPPTPASVTPAASAEPTSTGSTLPDVKMLAPILKIALAVLTIEQMVEIGLHVKMGAPGFKQFLESDVAKTKFRELYATYCDFLAGKIK